MSALPARPVKRTAMIGGAAVLGGAWVVAAAGHGVTLHMVAHMAAVAVAAPLLAFGLSGTPADPAARGPRLVAPLPMSLLELLVVWGWHVPAARAFASASVVGLALEQAMFAAAGLLLWSACLGARGAAAAGRRAAGVIALLLTTMHMTLLGVLITLAPRPLYETNAPAGLGGLPSPLAEQPLGLSPLADQQLGGVVMLLVGAGSYLVGGLVLLGTLLRARHAEVARPWS